jgi:predicted porin
MKKQNHRRGHALAVITLAVATAGAAVEAQAFEYTLSGQVNRLLTSVDDGTQSRLFQADNVNSQTRFRFTGAHQFAPGLKAGINWEVGYTSNPSSGISMTTRSVDATFNERHAEAYLLTDYGKVSFGQGDGAANGGMEVDLSGTSVISYSSVTDIGGKFAFRNAAGFGPTIDSTIGNLDFESRYDRVRYDSPKFGPISVSVSYGNKGNSDVYEAAGWAATEIGGGHRIAGALGFSREQKGGVAGNEDTAGGSASLLLSNGLNFTVGAASSQDDSPASVRKKYGYAKVGYTNGRHSVSIDYGRGEDFALNGDRSEAYGLGYVYAPEKWLDLYAGIKQHKLDRVAESYDKVSFVTAGMRLKF